MEIGDQFSLVKECVGAMIFGLELGVDTNMN